MSTYKKSLNHLITYSLIVFLFGCAGYQPKEVMPDHIKTVVIKTFSNKTTYYGLEEKLTREIIEEFIRDGRLMVAKPQDADSLLTGEIVSYVNEPLTYDENDVIEEYKLYIALDICFKDLTTGSMLWEEEWIKSDIRYYVTPKAGRMVETEEDAVDRAVKDLAQQIVHYIVRFQ